MLLELLGFRSVYLTLYFKSLWIKIELRQNVFSANVKSKHCPAQRDVDRRKSIAVRELHQSNNATVSEDGYEMVFSLSGLANVGLTANPDHNLSMPKPVASSDQSNFWIE